MSKSNVLPAATGYQGKDFAGKEAPQALDDIVIPVIEIDNGWSVDDIKTIDDCDDAYAYLMSAVASIEYSLDVEELKPQARQDYLWKAKARCALKYKKAALSIVNHKRGRISTEATAAKQNTRDRLLLEHIRSKVSDEQFMHWVEASGCNKQGGAA